MDGLSCLIQHKSVSQPCFRPRHERATPNAHRAVDIFVALVVAQRGEAHAQPVEHAQHAGAPADLVEALDAQQADQLAGAEGREDLGRVGHEPKDVRVPLKDAVQQVDLLEGREQG